MVALALMAFQLFHIKNLLDTYFDVQIARMEIAEAQQQANPPQMLPPIDNSAWTTIQVALPNDRGFVFSKIDNDDKTRVMAISDKWRKSSSGYPIHVDAQGNTTYLHKFLFGGPARHLNGDRLDNRKANLCAALRKKQRTEFEIKEPFVKDITELNIYNSVDPILALVNGYCRINYDNAKKFYIGNVRGGIPHGYGTMFKKHPPYEMTGIWENGIIDMGMTTYYKKLPRCMCEDVHPCPFRDIKSIEVIRNKRKLE